MTDIYADDNQPKIRWNATVYHVGFPRPAEIKGDDSYFLYVEVDSYGMVTVQDHSRWMGKTFKNLGWQEQREVYDFLIEWELAEWKRIGPEDSELFATAQLEDLASQRT